MRVPDPYQMRLRRRTWLPEARFDFAGIRSGCNAPGGRVHFLLQFKRIQDSGQRAAIAIGAGVQFLGYVHGNAYVVSMGVPDLEALLGYDIIRAAFPLEPELKIDERLRSGHVPAHADRPGAGMVLNVQFHDDIDDQHARAQVEKLGGEVLGQSSLIHLVTAAFPLDAVDRIAADDSVQYVDFVEPRLVPKSAEPKPSPAKGWRP